MGFYSKYVLPKMIDWACSQGPTMKQRAKVLPLAQGRVLELGVGTGLNLPFYDANKVQYVMGLDPEASNWKQASFDLESLAYDFDFVEAFAEDIPADNASFDTVLVTYTLCSIPSLSIAFDEVRRVMKPNANLIFCEHGKAPDAAVLKWQNRINPTWKKIGGGCNLNRDIPDLIRNNGFKIEVLESMYIPGWRPLSFNYWGSARTQ